jgi:hypothetical protein
MAYGTIMEFDVDLDTHRTIMEKVGDGPFDGLVLHVAGPSTHGIHSIDVWDSKEQADRFFAERIMPAMAALGIPGGPPLSFVEYDLPVVLRG